MQVRISPAEISTEKESHYCQMTTTEKLNAIAAKCRANLALAEKRTPGEWKRAGELATHVTCYCSRNSGNMICDLPDTSPERDQYAPNAAFIAACAGAAEAGWLATIAVIEVVQTYSNQASPFTVAEHWTCEVSRAILAAWEGLL
jgi:hypothetical protein